MQHWVWEGGKFDTFRLEQLVQEYAELSVLYAEANGFDAYKTAIDNVNAYLDNPKDKSDTQAVCDNHFAAIMAARNALTSSAYEGATKIYSVELLTRNFVAIGKPAGLKIITTPDVEKIQVGNTANTLLTNSSSLQTIKIDGVDTEVKAWLVSWVRPYTPQKIVSHRIHALVDANDTAGKGDFGDTNVVVYILFGADCFSELKVMVAPDKVDYVAGETLDTTGMEVTAYYGNGSTYMVVTDYEVSYQKGNAFSAGDTYVTISYTDYEGTFSVQVPVDVT